LNLKVLAVLIAGAAAVIALVLINPFESTPEVKEDAPWFYQVAESDIEAIEVRFRSETVTFLRDDDRKWQFEGLTGVAPQRKRWGGMVLILTGPKSRRLLQDRVDNPSQFGLTRPETEVTVRLSGGRDIRVSLGDKTTDGKHHYGQVEGFDQLFLITSSWGEVLRRLVVDPPLPAWFIQRNPNDITELSIIKGVGHGGNNDWLQFKIRDGAWTVQRHGVDTKWVGLQLDRWNVEGVPLLQGPIGQVVLQTHVDDFSPFGIFDLSTAIHLRFAGLTNRGTEYEDGVIYRIGFLNEEGTGYYARTEEGELAQPLLLLPVSWVDGIFALDDDPLYFEIPPRRADYEFLDNDDAGGNG
jgi:hypothetical protein